MSQDKTIRELQQEIFMIEMNDHMSESDYKRIEDILDEITQRKLEMEKISG